MSVRVIDAEPLLLSGECDYCGSIRVMSVADGDPRRYFCDECWTVGETVGPG